MQKISIKIYNDIVLNYLMGVRMDGKNFSEDEPFKTNRLANKQRQERAENILFHLQERKVR